MTPDIHNEPPSTSDPAVRCSALLAAVERLRDVWADRANHLERLAGYNQDISAEFNKAQARVIRECAGELYREIEAANDQALRSAPTADVERRKESGT